MKKIQVLEEDTYWYKKVRNGCWEVYRGSKKVSEHSMESGAQKMIESLMSNPNTN